tara:strand:+ start:396 stop:551 length:156 start_codon:yes stop_codon:yes gene_type:complete
MPSGKGSYGSKRGRPPLKKNADADKKPMTKKTGKGSVSMKEKMARLRALKK